ncbi:MAG: PDZ domain-containing protein [Bacteroidota bacterium]
MKCIKLLSLVFLLTCFMTTIYAQEAKKSVTIITRTIDKDGREMIKKQYAEGEEADKLLKEMDIDVDEEGQIRVEVETDADNRKQVKVRVESEKEVINDEENDININIDQEGDDRFTLRMNRDGEEEVFSWEGLNELPEELEKMLEELNLDLDLETLEFGDLGDFDMRNFDFAPNYGRAALGVRIEDAAVGTEIVEVSANSAAEQAGLKEGDVITAINGIPIERSGDLVRKMAKYELNERIEIEYERNGKNKTTQAVLKERAF